MTVLAVVLISAGVVFMGVSAVGLLRLPDVYTRAHAVAKSETLGLLLVFLGAFFLPDVDVDVFVRIVFIGAFALLANPTAVHALATAARRAGIAPWTTADAERARTAGDGAAATRSGEPRDGDRGAGA